MAQNWTVSKVTTEVAINYEQKLYRNIFIFFILPRSADILCSPLLNQLKDKKFIDKPIPISAKATRAA